MSKNRLLLCLLSAMAITLLGAVSFVAAQSPVELAFWHAMGGTNGQVVTDLVADFNASHTDVHVTEQRKGTSYNEALDAVIQASGQGEGPNISQIFDLGTPLAIDSGFFTPVQSVLSADQLKQINDDVMPPLINYFTVNDTLWSLPWNNSTPLLYYNKDMFKAPDSTRIRLRRPGKSWKPTAPRSWQRRPRRTASVCRYTAGTSNSGWRFRGRNWRITATVVRVALPRPT